MSINIILTYADWCIHCKHFKPIYDKVENEIKKNKVLKKYKIDIKSYNFADESEKEKFEDNYNDLKDMVNGYPTVIMQYDIDNKKGNKTINTTIIDSKNINNKTKDELEIEASEEFINNIVNTLKTEMSEGKHLYVQGGGDPYRNKKNKNYYDYVNFKLKYYELKNRI